VTVEEAPRLRPYLKLAEQLGSFAGQVTEDPIKRIVVEYEGHAASLNIKPLTGTILQAVLRSSLDNVNMVNAAHIAKERDIDVTEVRHEREGDYHTLIRLIVETGRFTRDIAGTLFAERRPRLVQIKGISVDAELGPHMLYVTNEDKPGMIGNLGKTLGDNGINIATFALGRSAPGKDAIALIEIDGAIAPEVLEKVRNLPNVRQAKALVF
jgi:D-3-phosphoglycerate dehydrogenase